jgi:hypothetical protein
VLKRLLIVLLVLLGLAAAADRFVAGAAERAAADQVRKTTKSTGDTDVKFHGFPFLTQAVRGRFEQVDVTVRGVPESGLSVTRIDAQFTGVRLSLGKAVSGELAAVPTDGATARVRLSYADLNAYLRRRGTIRVSGSAGRLAVSGQVRVRGALVTANGFATARLRPGSLVIQTTEAAVNGVAAPAAAVRALTVTVPLAALPFGIELEAVEVADDALVVVGSARSIVIPTKVLTQ